MKGRAEHHETRDILAVRLSIKRLILKADNLPAGSHLQEFLGSAALPEQNTAQELISYSLVLSPAV
jgi:hypothetical protein